MCCVLQISSQCMICRLILVRPTWFCSWPDHFISSILLVTAQEVFCGGDYTYPDHPVVTWDADQLSSNFLS